MFDKEVPHQLHVVSSDVSGELALDLAEVAGREDHRRVAVWGDANQLFAPVVRRGHKFNHAMPNKSVRCVVRGLPRHAERE
jgi:hypothetical protein